MNETVVAKSYMNHDQPQSSKSITRTCSPVDEQVREPDVGVHEAEAVAALAVGLEPAAHGGVEPPEQGELLGAHAQAVLPPAPVAARAPSVVE